MPNSLEDHLANRKNRQMPPTPIKKVGRMRFIQPASLIRWS